MVVKQAVCAKKTYFFQKIIAGGSIAGELGKLLGKNDQHRKCIIVKIMMMMAATAVDRET